MNDVATQETMAIAAVVASAQAAPAWVARVLPQVEALRDEYKAKYENEHKALTKKELREKKTPVTNPNIWTHLMGVATSLMAGDYDEAIEVLGTMVGMGRGIGHWVGGDVAKAIESLIEGVRADVRDKHPLRPSEAEMEAARAAIKSVRYLRLEGMSANEALRKDNIGCYGRNWQVRLDLMKADDPAIHPPMRSGQYTVFMRNGQLYARQWNVVDGFHDRTLTVLSNEPFDPIRPPLQKGTETAGTPMEGVRWETAYEYGSKCGVVLGYTWGEDGRDRVRFRADNGEIIDLPPHMLFPETTTSATSEARPDTNDAETRAVLEQIRSLELKARIAAENRHQQEAPDHTKRNTQAGRRRFDHLLEDELAKRKGQLDKLARRLRRSPSTVPPTVDAAKKPDRGIGDLVAWTAGGHQLVGELRDLDGEMATVARLVSGGGVQPEQRKVPLSRLRPATASGAEAAALAVHHKLAAQQQKWLDYHDTQFRTYIPSTSPDASYTKDFTLTSEAMLRDGRAHVVQDGLIRCGQGQIYVEKIENRFGKVVELRGYSVEPKESWGFVTRSAVLGQLPQYGTVIQGSDGKSYVVRDQHTWRIMSQLSPGERVRLKSTGEEKIVKDDSNRRSHGAIVYSLEGGGTATSLEIDRVDTHGDKVIKADDAGESNGGDKATRPTREGDTQVQGSQTETTVVFLPLEEYEQAFDASYAVMQLCNQSTKNGAANVVSVPAIALKGMLVTSSGGCSRGIDGSFDAWELVPEGSYSGVTTTVYHDESAIKAGLRDRGDLVGLIVAHHGMRFVLSRNIKVRSACPSEQYAVPMHDVLKHDAKERRYGWRAQYGDAVQWIEKAGFVLGVFGAPGDELVMLYYKNKKGSIESTCVKDIDAFTGPISDVGNHQEGNMAPKYKFAKDEAVRYKGEQYYWIGRKVGQFRLLAATPGSDSGFLIPESEVGLTVFPAPNKHGVFDKKHASVIEFKKDNNFYVRIYVLQVATDAWAAAAEIRRRDTGQSSPLSECAIQPSYEAAVKKELLPIVGRLAATAAGNTKSGWEGVKPAIAKQAMMQLLSQVPSQLMSAIIIEARSRAGENRG